MYEQQFNPFAANIAIVKGYLKSGKVLAIGILYLVSLALGILSILTRPTTVGYQQYLALLERLGLDTTYLPYPEFGGAMEASATASAVASILASSVISVLIAVAFILMFAKSRSQKPDSSPIAGVIIMHVLSIITFVAAIIITVFIGIFYLLIVGAALLTEPSKESVIMMVVVGVLAICAAFIIMFSAAAMKNYYRSIRHSLNTVSLHNKGALAYGVICIIMAVFSGLSLIGTLLTPVLVNRYAFDPLSVASAVITFAIQVLNASIALGYNKYINRQTLGYNNTPYGGTPANAYAPMPGAQPTYPNQPYQNQPSVPYNDNFANYNAPQQSVPYNDNFTDYNAPASQPKPSVCPYCGAPTEPAQSFCGNCGNKL